MQVKNRLSEIDQRQSFVYRTKCQLLLSELSWRHIAMIGGPCSDAKIQLIRSAISI